MKNRALVLGGLFILLVTVLSGLHASKSVRKDIDTDIEKPTTSPQPQDTGKSRRPTTVDKKKKTSGLLNSEEFQLELQTEARKVGQVDAHPDHTARELQEWAKNLNSEQIQILKNKTLDIQTDGDERSLSVYLLSLNQDPTTLNILNEIAMSPLPTSVNDRQLTFEEILRGQALEGIIHSQFHDTSKNMLENLAKTSNSSFLADRAQRGLAFFQAQAEAPSEQEHKALQKYLKKTR